MKSCAELFRDQDVEIVPIIEYVRWFLYENHPEYKLIQLPPIQRGAVWKIGQMERLWDSLLRGFPIGGFLLSPRAKGSQSRDIKSGEQIAGSRDGWFLLDGHQRTRALLLGFQPADTARLWIDLTPPPISENADNNDRMFLFRLLTQAQPWGMDWNNPDTRLDEDTKRKPRLELVKARYDYEVKIDTRRYDGQDWQPDARASWPLRAGFPVPFDALIGLCGGMKNFKRPSWDDVKKLAHPKCLISENDKTEIEKHLNRLLDTIEKVVYGRCKIITLHHLNPSEDPFLQLQEEIKDLSKAEKVQDAIEVLFRRVNAGGTTLAGEEMSYSLLKARWDGAYSLVNRIIKDNEVGYMLPPSSLVLAAARLALRETIGADKKPPRDIAHPSVSDFRRWISEKGKKDHENKSFMVAMRSQLEPTISDHSEVKLGRFHSAIKRLCQTVLYDVDRSDSIDPGLPKKLLLSVVPVMLHPVLYWLELRQCDTQEAIEESRLPLLRYLLFSLLGVTDAPKASLYAFEVLQKENFPKFPDRRIYEYWRKPGSDSNNRVRDPVALTLPTPDQLADPVESPVDGLLRDWVTLFGGDDTTNPHRDFRRRFWAVDRQYWRHRDLLLWFQRVYLPDWFPGYDPMREDGADKPYHEDHILARAHIVKQGNSPWDTDTKSDAPREFRDRRWFYVDSLGNFRLWPLWANCSDGQKSPDQKLRLTLELNEIKDDNQVKELGLNSAEDFLTASAIDTAHRDYWLEAGGKPFEWPKQRRIAWQTAVEKRIEWLYHQMYNTLSFTSWHQDSEKSE